MFLGEDGLSFIYLLGGFGLARSLSGSGQALPCLENIQAGSDRALGRYLSHRVEGFCCRDSTRIARFVESLPSDVVFSKFVWVLEP